MRLKIYALRVPGLSFQSTHLLRDASGYAFRRHFYPKISIHASLARCVFKLIFNFFWHFNFNPRISCEMRQNGDSVRGTHLYFNPRISCEMRPTDFSGTTVPADFNPRISCEMRRVRRTTVLKGAYISIHASLARCVCRQSKQGNKARQFQSTHLLRDASDRQASNAHI